MKKLLFLFFSAMFIVACDEKTTDDTLSVNREVLEFAATGGTAEFQIITEKSWQILIADEKSNVALSAKSGTGNATITVTVPFTNSMVEENTRLIVRTDDGSSIRNVLLRQSGHLVSGSTIAITNWGNLLPMDGYAFAEDSLIITSNEPWQLKGPEWIEAYNGTTWVKLSTERAMVSGAATIKDQGKDATTVIKIRCATENSSDEDRVGTLVLESAYDSSKYKDIRISQLGRYRVDACQVHALAYSFAWTWKCGKEVKYIYCYVGHEFTADLSQWYTALPEYVFSVDGLEPNTGYIIYSLGVDGNGNYQDLVGRLGYSTGSDINQPLATISDVDYDGRQFTWLVTQNEYSYGFYDAKLTNPDLFDLPDALIAWLIDKAIQDGPSMLWLERQMYFSFESSQHIQIVTRSMSQGSLKPSDLLTRYDTSKDGTRSEDGYKSEDGPRYVSRPFNMEEFKKSVIIIKK